MPVTASGSFGWRARDALPLGYRVRTACSLPHRRTDVIYTDEPPKVHWVDEGWVPRFLGPFLWGLGWLCWLLALGGGGGQRCLETYDLCGLRQPLAWAVIVPPLLIFLAVPPGFPRGIEPPGKRCPF